MGGGHTHVARFHLPEAPGESAGWGGGGALGPTCALLALARATPEIVYKFYPGIGVLVHEMFKLHWTK